jgi:hypothetical protein
VGNGEAVFVRFETVMEMATTSYEVSEMYNEITRELSKTESGRGQLTDKNGEATAADRAVLDLLDEFEAYLTTTTARYHLTGEQLQTAAERYAEAENVNAARLQTILDSLEASGLGDYEGEGNPDRQARDTDRPDEANDEQAEGYATDEDLRSSTRSAKGIER